MRDTLSATWLVLLFVGLLGVAVGCCGPVMP